MKNVRSLLLVVLLLVTSSGTALAMNDADIRDLLPGTWELTVNKDGRSLVAITTVSGEGTFVGEAVFTSPDGEFAARIEGDWWVKGGKIFSQISRTTHNDLFPLGRVQAEKVIELDNIKLVYEAQDGSQVTEYRK